MERAPLPPSKSLRRKAVDGALEAAAVAGILNCFLVWRSLPQNYHATFADLLFLIAAPAAAYLVLLVAGMYIPSIFPFSKIGWLAVLVVPFDFAVVTMAIATAISVKLNVLVSPFRAQIFAGSWAHWTLITRLYLMAVAGVALIAIISQIKSKLVRST